MRNNIGMTNIAEKIISKFPSPQSIAELCDVDVSTVHKWKYPKERGGQNGLIPAPYQQLILDGAPQYGVELKPDDFFVSDSHEIKQKRRTSKRLNVESQHNN